MKYAAPKAEVVELELGTAILFESFDCIIFYTDTPECTEKLPDFYE